MLKATKGGELEKQSVINECSLIKALNSEHIVTCEEVFDWENKIYVFLELMDGGDLSKIVRFNSKSYSEDFCRYTLWKVAKGLQVMHKNNVIHRDIKSENILCTKQGDIKIADLGLSVFLHEQQMYRKSLRGTPNWFSPEIANGIFYSREVDVWAFGCFAYELATGEPPFSDHARDQTSLFDAILRLPIPSIGGKWAPAF